jgi:hypothetical protein
VVVAKLMTPVVALMLTPAGAVNVPPVVKPAAVVGTGLVPLAQTGLVYENPVTGVVVGLIVIDVFEEPASRQPDAGTEYVMV